MSVKTACVVQGNLRRGSTEVLAELSKHFDHVILSTWNEEASLIPPGSFQVVLSEKPQNPGYSNRNFQRVSTSAGLKAAESLGCTHVLKWRTDMLPTKLDVAKLLEWSGYQVPAGVSSRIVTCAFRNLTVIPDEFSSMPDLFAFGSLEMMKLLWDADGFDFTQNHNLPKGVSLPEIYTKDFEHLSGNCSESEVYLHFKKRLEKKIGRKLNHTEIASDFLYLINHERLGICWFGPVAGFRSILQALVHPWWTEKTWQNKRPIIYAPEYPQHKFWWQFFMLRYTPIAIWFAMQRQHYWYSKYKSENRVASS